MRRLIATASFCLLACSTCLAADQKLFNDSLNGAANSSSSAADGVTVKAKTPALPLDPQPLEQKPADLSGSIPAFKILTDKPIDIPPQTGTAELLAPRDLPLPPEKPQPKVVVNRSTEEVCDAVSNAVQSANIPAPFFIRLLYQESGFKPGIVSHAGAQGIAQFMPETAHRMGLQNPFDPVQAIPAAARFLRGLVDKFGNLGLAAAAYNAGPGRIHNWLEKKSSLPHETQGYVKIITGVPAENWKDTSNVATATKVPAQAPCRDLVIASAADANPVAPAPVAPQKEPVSNDKLAARGKTRVAARKPPVRKSNVQVAEHEAHERVAEHRSEPRVAAHEHKAVERVAANEHKHQRVAANEHKTAEHTSQHKPQKPERKRVAMR
jgi:transglycosylase-like protein with SLT domain